MWSRGRPDTTLGPYATTAAGVRYLELRSTPRATAHMTKRRYAETLVGAVRDAAVRGVGVGVGVAVQHGRNE